MSTTGSDTNAGTFDHLSCNRQGHGVVVHGVQPLAIPFLSEGGYTPSRPFHQHLKERAQHRTVLSPRVSRERPVLDCSAQVVNGSNRGILLKGNYWHIKGLDVKGLATMA